MSLRGIFIGCGLCLFGLPLWAKDVLTVGILAFRSTPETELQWQPLAQYLRTAMPDFDFKVVALDLPHLREAVRQTQVDMVITQPAEYVRMAHENGLSSPLATLLNSYEGEPVRVFGGTILARAGQSDINSLADLQGKRVAASSKDSFAGYQLQAYVLHMARIATGQVLETGNAQDTAIRAVLEDRADAAFVRSGLWETMLKEGRLAPGQLKVVNVQQMTGYPFAVSTRLYPEWPVIALPHVREETSARLAGALLSLPHHSEFTKAMGIDGFAVPSDYESVRTVMRTMRVPPFDAEVRISLADIWEQYWAQSIAAMAASLAIALLAIRGTLLSRKFRDLNDHLEVRINERTSELAVRNSDLAQTLEKLGQARDELVESAKLAALGSMVAGIAHELNTPIGNGLTVATTLDERSRDFKKEMDNGLKRSTLEAFVSDATLASDILVHSLQRAAALVSSFKQVAVDQTSSQRRPFMLKSTLDEVLLTLSPTLKRSACEVKMDFAHDDVRMDSFPGPLGQVLVNLINNCLVHGYGDGKMGDIRIQVTVPESGFVDIAVSDDGVGIPAVHLGRVFEPFFTTRLGKGGSGLGLSITRNIVVGVLGGKLSVASNPGQGTTFSVVLPVVAPQSQT